MLIFRFKGFNYNIYTKPEHACTFVFTDFTNDCTLRLNPNILRKVHTSLSTIRVNFELQVP